MKITIEIAESGKLRCMEEYKHSNGTCFVFWTITGVTLIKGQLYFC